MRASRLASRASCWAAVAVLALAAPLAAQQPAGSARVRAQREELERVRQERDALQRRLRELQSSAYDLKEEVQNLDRQASATARLVRALDGQLVEINRDVEDANASLVRAEDDLSDKRTALRRRLIDISKRGPLYSAEVLLSAQSIGELVTRYKYLHLLALRDRSLVSAVERLRDRVQEQRARLLRLQSELAENRSERAAEEDRLRSLETRRGRNLVAVQQTLTQTQRRLAQIQRSEQRLTGAIATFEAARRRAEAAAAAAATRGGRAAPAATASTLRTSDLGRLDWPVDGTVIYRFGRVVNPNNTTTRWNGIGISASSGTGVRAIAPGEVVLAGTMGTYGLTVIVQHGGGDYSVYGSLQRADVRVGQTIRKGQVVGAVGAADPELPAHLHFEIRRARGVAVDPLEWLRGAR